MTTKNCDTCKKDIVLSEFGKKGEKYNKNCKACCEKKNNSKLCPHKKRKHRCEECSKNANTI